MSDVAVGKTFENCLCSSFLLEIENRVIETREQYIQQGFPEEGNLGALLAFRLLEGELNAHAQKYFEMTAETYLDSKFTIPDEGERTLNYPWLGEAAARNFLREAFFTLNDRDSGLSDTWLFFRHGAALATYWGHWRAFAHRTPDGFNYADLEIAKIIAVQHSGVGGNTKAQNQGVELKEKYANWQRRAAAFPNDMSKIEKARRIAKAITKEGGETNSPNRIRRKI